jgi:hypothetical protein
MRQGFDPDGGYCRKFGNSGIDFVTQAARWSEGLPDKS